MITLLFRYRCRFVADLFQQPDKRLALLTAEGGGREPFHVGGVIGVDPCDQLPAFLRQMHYSCPPIGAVSATLH